MTILRQAQVQRTFRNYGAPVAVQVNSTSAAWPLYDGGVTGPASASPLFPSPPAVMLVHNGGSTCLFRFGLDATISVAPHSGNVHRIEAGQAVLFDEAEYSGPSSWIAILAPGGSAKVTVYKGSTAKSIAFASPGDTIDPFDLPNASGGAFSVGFLSAPFSVGSAQNSGTITTTGFPT